MKKCILFLCLSVCAGFIIWYCVSKQENANVPSVAADFDCITIEVNTPQNVGELDLIDTVHFLKLEANEGAYFGHITKLRVYQDRIFIFDKRYASSVFIYTTQGKHVKTINRKGRGPGEYVYLSNFEIDYVNQRLMLMDDFLAKLLYFDFNGNFIREMKSDFGAKHAACLGKNRMVHAKLVGDYRKEQGEKEENELIVVEEDGKSIFKHYYDDKPSNLNYSIDDVLRGMPNGTVNYAPLLRDTIYTIYEDGSVKPRYAIKYKDRVSDDYLYNVTAEEFMRQIAHGKNCFLGHNIETENYLYFRLGIGWHNNPVFYLKNTKKAIMVQRKRGDLEDLFEPIASNGTYFWGMILPTKIEKLKSDHIIFENRNLDISEDDNPWLFYYKLKSV